MSAIHEVSLEDSELLAYPDWLGCVSGEGEVCGGSEAVDVGKTLGEGATGWELDVNGLADKVGAGEVEAGCGGEDCGAEVSAYKLTHRTMMAENDTTNIMVPFFKVCSHSLFFS